MKKFTKTVTDSINRCERQGLDTRPLEKAAADFITNEYHRYFFGSKIAQTCYKMNNCVASTSLGYWGYRSVGALGTTNRFMLGTHLCRSALPIAYFTGVTLKFWT